MENRELKSILQDALESEFPASQIDLPPEVRKRLVAANIQQGVKMNTVSSRRISRLVLVTLAVALLMAIAFVTPQGRAFAQNIMQLFVRADRDHYPLQPWQMTPPMQTSPGSPFQLSVQEAEALAGYDVLSPLSIPSGMVFVGASYDEKYHEVAQAFGQSPEYLELSLWQQPLAEYQSCGDMSKLCDHMLGQSLVGASAYMESVQIEGADSGEYVEGVWELTDQGPVWNPTPYSKILRWKTDRMILELVYNGTELNKEDLIGLANRIR